MADAATTVQDQVIDTMTTAQEATIKVLKGWTHTLATMPPVSEFYTQPKLDGFYGFAERVWAVQKDFVVKLLEVATEAGKTVPENLRKNTERAAHAAPVAK